MGNSGSIRAAGQYLVMASGNSVQSSGAIGFIVGASLSNGGSVFMRSGMSSSTAGGVLAVASGPSELASSGNYQLEVLAWNPTIRLRLGGN